MIIQYVFAVIVDSLQSFKFWCDVNQLASPGFNGRIIELRDIRYIVVIHPDNLRGWNLDGIIETDTAKLNPKYHEIMAISNICLTA